ncbi:MAG: S-layer homology domain-containing protein [Oscillospiraceae bacterium]|jgi:hypothetical protein|nr:S-layer homology domain-containing protein [Oscillospiraceae bacterium]
MLKKSMAALLTVVMLFSLIQFSGVGSAAETEEIIYNLGTREIALTKADFDENGSYTIPLETDAFFPYEVQFKANGVTTTEWFDTPESIVSVGEYTFAVSSARTGEDKLTQIGVYIGGEYVAARPEAKTFTSELGFGTLSLLPLTEVSVTLDLTAYLRAELKMTKVSAVISAINETTPTPSPAIGEGQAVVWAKKSWAYGSEDDFKIVSRDDYTDLTPMSNSTYSSEGGSYSPSYLELIVGTAKQLNANNTRYIVTVKTAPYDEIVYDFELYTQDGDTRDAVSADVSYSSWISRYIDGQYQGNSISGYQLSVQSAYEYDDEYYLGIKLKEAYSSRVDSVSVYSGWYETAEEATGANTDVTSSVWNQTMSSAGSGLKGIYNSYPDTKIFTVVFKKDSNVVGIEQFALNVYPKTTGIEYYSSLKASGETSAAVSYSYDYSVQSGVTTVTHTLYKEYPASSQYYLALRYYDDGELSQASVTKAVVGHYDTLDAASAQTDIKSSLFPESPGSENTGYLASYGGSGVNFTVFTETEIYKLTVKAITGSISNTASAPYQTPGSSDVYFNINGANQITGASGEGEATSIGLSVYTVDPSDDSYFINGYQTALILSDSANLASIAPTFGTGHNADIHVSGAKQTSGTNVQDFSGGPVQYTAKAEDGKSLKNYWVTFAKKETSAKLFVNGPHGAAGAAKDKDTNTREIFLTPEYDNHHDIFIANIGGRELTGLSVTLSDAQNVKLDEYWTVGGDGNSTLAAFTETYHSGSSYGEIANVAKIRLVPGGEEGTVSGKLTISSSSGGSYVVYLEGVAGNPKIVTTQTDLDNKKAVKFVPYSFLIQTDSKYDWNRVSFWRVSGRLPNGVTLKENGEIYGVPTETGTFKFGVQAQYSYSGFRTSTAEFTLTVLDNTDANVNAQVDEGYGIRVRVPGAMTSYSEQIFEVEGGFNEFMDFYLDGVRLVKDTDYIAEEGSTKITIKSQTFQAKGVGKHTIAAEFREDGDTSKEMKKAAQNYTLNIGGGGGSYSGGASGSSSSTGTTTLNTTVAAAVEGGTATAAVRAQLFRDAAAAGSAITIESSLGDIVMDAAAVKALGGSADGTIEFTVITDPNGEISISIKLTLGGSTITDFGKGIVTISIPYTLASGTRWTQIVPYFVNDGKLELVMGGYSATTKSVDLQLRHLSDYVVKVNDKQYEGRGGWYDDSLDWAVQRDLLDKFIVDGKINAAQDVSRGDFVTALLKALGIQPLTTFTAEQFSDVSGENAAYIRTARELGVVNGVGGGRFYPDVTAKRGEQFQIVYNLIKANISTVSSKSTDRKIEDFQDADAVPGWLKPALSELLRLGVIQGDGTNLRVKDDFTVGEFCVVIQKMAAPKVSV